MKKTVFALASISLLVLGGCGGGKRTFEERLEGDRGRGGEDRSRNSAEYTTNLPEVDGNTLRRMPEDDGVFREFHIESVEEYIETFSGIAQDEMISFGIPASITLAQGILESGAGRGRLTEKSNNHFGIKCHQEWDGERVYHDDDELGECFRRYNHPMYSFRDHSVFLSSRARYKFLFDYHRTDYRSWAYGLKRAGYATDPQYPRKLISLIERYKLYQYDSELVDQGLPVKRDPVSKETITYVVRQGDTLYSISQRYYVTIEDLIRWNRLSDDTIDIGQELRIEVDQR